MRSGPRRLYWLDELLVSASPWLLARTKKRAFLIERRPADAARMSFGVPGRIKRVDPGILTTTNGTVGEIIGPGREGVGDCDGTLMRHHGAELPSAISSLALTMFCLACL